MRFSDFRQFKPATERAASALRQTLVWVVVSESDEADSLVAQALREQADALFVVGGAKTYGMRARLVELAAKHRLPAIYDVPAFAEAGGLLTHSPSLTGSFREIARYVDRILKGAKPGDLPIEQPTKFETVVNLKTANALGLTISQSLLLRADRVIK